MNSTIFEGKTSKGISVVIRYPHEGDLEILLEFINQLSLERTFIRFQGEQQTLAEEKEYLDGMLKKIAKKEGMMLLAFTNGVLVGSSTIELKILNSSHVGEFGIVVKKEYRNSGIGSLLMQKILEEAVKYIPTLEIVDLHVYKPNIAAKKIYSEKFGFKEYGTLPLGAKVQNEFVDQIFMYKRVRP